MSLGRIATLVALLCSSLAFAQAPHGGTRVGVAIASGIGSSPSNAGMTLSAGTLTLQPADATHPGVVSTGAQTLAGTKTFSGGLVSDSVATNTATTFTQTSSATDGSSAVAFSRNASAGLSTAGAKLDRWLSNGTEKAAMDVNGLVSTALPHPSIKRLGQWELLTTADTSFTAVGAPALTLRGTASANASATTRNLLLFTSSGSINGDAGIWGNAGGVTGQTKFSYLPRATFIIRTGSVVTDQFLFIGLVDNTNMVGNFGGISGLSGHALVGLGYDTSQSRTTFWATSSDATTASEINTGVTVSANTDYVITIDMTISGAVIFTVNGTRVVKTTNIPGAVAADVFCSTRNITNAGVKTLSIGSIALEQN